jgi:hypothetical protein
LHKICEILPPTSAAALGTPAPIAEVSLAAGAQLPATLEVVPVVFIRNRALHGMDRGAGRALAKKTRSQIDLRAAALGVLPNEIQLDCDWTGETREPYFALINAGALALSDAREPFFQQRYAFQLLRLRF